MTCSNCNLFYISAPIVTDPCSPNPCGPNSVCRASGTVAHCSCRSAMFEEPPSCRPECHVDSDCPPTLACRNNKCRDPCPGSCGTHAMCRTVSHSPICTCPSHYTGDPFVRCLEGKVNVLFCKDWLFNLNKVWFTYFTYVPTVHGIEAEQKSPCPDCGPNADCVDSICRCRADFIGAPPYCRPECLKSSECDWKLMCLNRRCTDPCPGACGQGAVCTAFAHEPRCDCPPSTTGNPFIECRPIENICKTDSHGRLLLWIAVLNCCSIKQTRRSYINYSVMTLCFRF